MRRSTPQLLVDARRTCRGLRDEPPDCSCRTVQSNELPSWERYRFDQTSDSTGLAFSRPQNLILCPRSAAVRVKERRAFPELGGSAFSPWDG